MKNSCLWIAEVISDLSACAKENGNFDLEIALMSAQMIAMDTCPSDEPQSGTNIALSASPQAPTKPWH